MTHKIPKILISILMSIAIAVNPFSFVTFAVDPGTIGGIIVGLIYAAYEGYVAGTTAVGGTEVAWDIHSAQQHALSEYERALDLVGDEDGINFYTPDGLIYYASYSDSLTGDDLEFAEFFCDSVNTYGVLPTYDTVLQDFVITPRDYEKLKNRITNDYLQYVTEKTMKESSGELADSLGENAFPTYSFDFVGPMPQFSIPVTQGVGLLSKDGFIFTVPVSGSSIRYDYSRFEREETAKASLNGFSDINVFGNDDMGWYASASADCYGWSNYCMYNGKLYYFCQNGYYGEIATRSFNTNFVPKYPALYFASDGTCLADTDFNYETSSYTVGACINTTGVVSSCYPVVETSVSDDDFITTSGGGVVEVPRSEDEEIIGNAIGLGLITPDSLLTIGENGTITAADNIELAKLQELCDLIASGNLQFEDVQEYLNLITQLIGAGNLTASEQKILLDNLNSLTETQNADISEIKTAVLAISEALTSESEIEDVEIDFSYISVEHHGLVEAQMIVDTALPVVSQSKQLIMNLMNSPTSASTGSASGAPPNFSFFFDSNNDGVAEKYTIFDLSFMEQTLNNENLEDKGRFEKPMTIREFIQALIVLFAYVGFAVKILRKLPGMFGSSESFTDDIITISRY